MSYGFFVSLVWDGLCFLFSLVCASWLCTRYRSFFFSILLITAACFWFFWFSLTRASFEMHRHPCATSWHKRWRALYSIPSMERNINQHNLID